LEDKFAQQVCVGVTDVDDVTEVTDEDAQHKYDANESSITTQEIPEDSNKAADDFSELEEMPADHPEREHDEEALEPEDDVVKQVHLCLEIPHRLQPRQDDGDDHHAAQHEPALLPKIVDISVDGAAEEPCGEGDGRLDGGHHPMVDRLSLLQLPLRGPQV